MGTSQFNLETLLSSFAGLLKAFEIIVALLFIVYALFALKEVGMMNKALVSPLAPKLKSIALFQVLVGVLGLVLLLIILFIK